MNEIIKNLFEKQIAHWDLAYNNYAELEKLSVKEFCINQNVYKVQHNPGRIISSMAQVDNVATIKRKCFLCPSNLPSRQLRLHYNADYQILINPYPIFPCHLTIPDLSHIPQHILMRFPILLELMETLDGFVVFYNGPQCGASAPDHHHFQAGTRGFLPLESEVESRKEMIVLQENNATLYFGNTNIHPVFIIESDNKEDAITLFERIYNAMELKEGENEPMMNIIGWKDSDKWVICVFPRAKHRPDCYFAQGDANMLISPGASDMGGVVITSEQKDFDKITAEDIVRIAKEVCLSAEDSERLIERIQQGVKIERSN